DDRRPGRSAREPVDAGRDVDRDGPYVAAARRDEARGSVELAAEPRPVHRVEEQVGALTRTRERIVAESLRELEDIDAHTPTVEPTPGDETVTTVVPLAAHDHNTRAVTPVEQPARLPGNRAACAVHQHLDRGTGRDRGAVARGHLVRCEHRAHGAPS